MQADLVKPAALAGQGFGVEVGVDSEVIESFGLKDLAFRLTGINWEQEPEDGDQCAEGHEVCLVLLSSSKHSVSGALLKGNFFIRSST